MAHGDAVVFRITERQRQVVALVAMGRTDEQIGRELCISPRTARAHADALRVKLGVRSRRELPVEYRRATGVDPLANVCAQHTQEQEARGDGSRAQCGVRKPPHRDKVARGSLPQATLTTVSASLSSRERQVLSLTAQGLANKEIAAALSIALPSVKNHLTTIYMKVGARNRLEAVRAVGF